MMTPASFLLVKMQGAEGGQGGMDKRGVFHGHRAVGAELVVTGLVNSRGGRNVYVPRATPPPIYSRFSFTDGQV